MYIITILLPSTPHPPHRGRAACHVAFPPLSNSFTPHKLCLNVCVCVYLCVSRCMYMYIYVHRFILMHRFIVHAARANLPCVMTTSVSFIMPPFNRHPPTLFTTMASAWPPRHFSFRWSASLPIPFWPPVPAHLRHREGRTGGEYLKPSGCSQTRPCSATGPSAALGATWLPAWSRRSPPADALLLSWNPSWRSQDQGQRRKKRLQEQEKLLLMLLQQEVAPYPASGASASDSATADSASSCSSTGSAGAEDYLSRQGSSAWAALGRAFPE
jgi:hypothetical protein